MNEFAVVWQHRGTIFSGFENTLIIVAVGATGALVLGTLLTVPLMARQSAIRIVAMAYVDAMRCVPFLLFVYLIYYGLPSLGLRFDNWSTGIAALVLYNAAYMAELLRASWADVPQEQIEAGYAFGFSGLQLFRRIILPPVLLSALPLLGNQLIQIVKDSAFLTIIAVAELTHQATAIQTTYFVPFASFIAALVLYWVTCIGIESTVGYVSRFAEERR
jgi:polar amino acid transport system permease protein